VPNLRVTRPLNHAAVAKANDDFFKSHPELVSNGRRTPLDPCSAKQGKLRLEWLKSYEKHGGGVKTVKKEEVRRARDKLKKLPPKSPEPVHACSVDVAPPPPKTIVSKAVDPTVPCALITTKITCAHGRAPGPEAILVVVPESTASMGDLISGRLTMKGGCGQHPSWSVGGFWTSEGNSASFSFNAKTWLVSGAGFFSLKNVSPHCYRVETGACSGGGQVYDVRAYPPGKITAKFDISKVVENLKHGFKLLPLDHEEIERWEFLKGAVTYEGAWKEDPTSWNGFYEMQIQGGFDPLAKFEHSGPIYPLTLVPGWLARWVKAGFFWKLGFVSKLQIAVVGRLWTDKSAIDWSEYVVSGSGGGEGQISIEAKLVSPDFVQGSLAGKTGLGLEAKGVKSDEVEIGVKLKFDGVKGVVTLKAAWGWVEWSREFQLMEERELPLGTWKFGTQESEHGAQ
jgi:hypothetical protein